MNQFNNTNVKSDDVVVISEAKQTIQTTNNTNVKPDIIVTSKATQTIQLTNQCSIM